MRRRYTLRDQGPLVVLILALALPAAAQQGILPGDERVEPPGFEDPGSQPDLELPPPPPLTPEERRRPASVPRGYVSRIVVDGSTVFSEAELAEATAPFVGRLLSAEGLYQARDAVTRLYQQRGYITSGAILPDQEVREGVVHLRVVEGRLAQVEIAPTRFFRPGYFRSRLARAGRAPVDVYRLERALQLLQSDPLVERVTARLEPTAARGESRLVVEVVEALPVGLDLVASNHRAVSVGEYAGDVISYAANLIGIRDELRFDFGVASGLLDFYVSYAVPVTPWDTLVGFHFRDSNGDVVLEEFEPLDIQSFARTLGFSLEQPIFRDTGRELRAGLIAEYRESNTTLRDDDFCTIAGAIDCRPQLAVLRFFQQYSASRQRSALAMRSAFSVGIDTLDATRNPGAVADGQFFSWLGQMQWVYQLPDTLRDSLIVTRLDTQLAADPLLPIEKFAVGGARTVRGYRENQLVRDSGVVGSVEVRVPVLRLRRSGLSLELAGFLDFGHAWDEAGPGQLETGTLASMGPGVRVDFRNLLHGQLYYGGRLIEAPPAPAPGLQRDGIHFRVAVDAVNLVQTGVGRWRR